MKKLLVIFFICSFLVTGIAIAQEKRIYNDGEIDYVPISAKIKLIAEDSESSVKYVEYSVNGQSIKRYSGPISFTEEGRNFVAYRAIDNTGNISQEKIYSCIVDDAPPYLSATVNGPAYMAGDVAYITDDTSIILWAEDELSGVQAIYVGLGDSGYWRFTGDANIEKEGKHTGKAYAVDNVGNKTNVFRIEGYVDNTPPSVTIEPKYDFVNLQGSIYTSIKNEYSVSADDNISGVKEIKVSVDRGEYFTYTEPIKLQETGYHSIRAKAVDYLNNESEATELTFYIDVKTPRTDVEISID
jgi:hypothetical protein